MGKKKGGKRQKADESTKPDENEAPVEAVAEAAAETTEEAPSPSVPAQPPASTDEVAEAPAHEEAQEEGEPQPETEPETEPEAEAEAEAEAEVEQAAATTEDEVRDDTAEANPGEATPVETQHATEHAEDTTVPEAVAPPQEEAVEPEVPPSPRVEQPQSEEEHVPPSPRAEAPPQQQQPETNTSREASKAYSSGSSVRSFSMASAVPSSLASPPTMSPAGSPEKNRQEWLRLKSSITPVTSARSKAVASETKAASQLFAKHIGQSVKSIKAGCKHTSNLRKLPSYIALQAQVDEAQQLCSQATVYGNNGSKLHDKMVTSSVAVEQCTNALAHSGRRLRSTLSKVCNIES